MLRIGIGILMFLWSMMAFALLEPTRFAQISNDKVTVWERIINPGETLRMHHHDHDRVVIPLTDGIFKVVSNKGDVHLFKMQKYKSHYLPRDSKGELHLDENIGKQPVKVIVVELQEKNNTH